MADLRIETRVGRADWGENQFRGHAVAGELAGRERWGSMIALAVAGRRLTRKDAEVLEDAAICTLAADPRIWPLKITRLASAYGSALAGFAAGHLVLEEALMGSWPTGNSAAFLLEVRAALGDRVGDPVAIETFVLAELARGRKLPGFGVPFRPKDERLLALAECLRQRDRDGGTHWRLAMAIDDVMSRHKNVHGNQSLALGALLLDLGFTPADIPLLTTAMLDLCYYANAVEGAEQRPAILQRLPPDCVEYVGREARLSPRAAAKRTLDSQSPVLAAPVFR